MTPKEVAEVLRISPQTVTDYLEEGTLKGFKLGKSKQARWRIKAADLADYINNKE